MPEERIVSKCPEGVEICDFYYEPDSEVNSMLTNKIEEASRSWCSRHCKHGCVGKTSPGFMQAGVMKEMTSEKFQFNFEEESRAPSNKSKP